MAIVLGYQRTAKAIQDHVDDEDNLGSQIATSGQRRKMTVINESGLYSLILSSKMPNAITNRYRNSSSRITVSLVAQRLGGRYYLGLSKSGQNEVDKSKDLGAFYCDKLLRFVFVCIPVVLIW